jgi:hypothetical protein
MKTFTKPSNLNGEELMAELAAVGIIVEEIRDNGEGLISFITDDEELAASIVAKHNGNQIPPEPTVEDKLASVGLNLEDLRAAILGGN